MTADTKIALALGAAVAAILVARAVRGNLQSNAALAVGLGTAGLLVNSAHDQRNTRLT